MLETLKTWDREIFVFLNGLGTKYFDGFWLFITKIESWTPFFIFLIFLIFYYYKSKKGTIVFLFSILAFATTYAFTVIVKDYVARIRPNNVDALAELIRIIQTPTSYSFFSGHASTSFSITIFVVLALREYTKWIYLAFLWPVFFSISRIYVGVHFPSDIIVGAVVGVIFGFAAYFFCRKSLRKIQLSHP